MLCFSGTNLRPLLSKLLSAGVRGKFSGMVWMIFLFWLVEELVVFRLLEEVGRRSSNLRSLVSLRCFRGGQIL